MVSNIRVRIILIALILAAGSFGQAHAQSAVDTLRLTPVSPDSFYVVRRGSDIVIGWYPPHDSISSVIGSRDYTNWFGEHTRSEGVEISYSGYYTGDVDRTIRVDKLGRETAVVGVDPEIVVVVSTSDIFNRTYEKTVNIGTDDYVPGDPVPVVLGEVVLEGEPDTLDLGFNIHFAAGIVDTSFSGAAASFALDLQEFEGFHVWRGLSPYPSEMEVIAEISKEDYFRVSEIEEIEDVPVTWKWLWEYFNDNVTPAWPRRDAQDRIYYEWIDENVFVGFEYHYVVTTYDRGYFKGFFLYNKRDNFVCDENLEDPRDPGDPVPCESATKSFVMTVDSSADMQKVYVVPNPYRTGTSAVTSPYYHNFPDGTIKFFNLPRSATVKIYTVSGDLVWEALHESPEGSDGVLSWSARNRNGLDVTSGVYVYRVENNDTDGEVYGRIVVIR